MYTGHAGKIVYTALITNQYTNIDLSYMEVQRPLTNSNLLLPPADCVLRL